MRKAALLPATVLEGPLGFPIQPWAVPLTRLSSYRSKVLRALSWALVPRLIDAAAFPIAARPLSDCSAALPPTFNGSFIINDLPVVRCSFSADSTSVAAFASSLNSGFSACGIAHHIVAKAVPRGATCLQLVLQAASAGVVYRFSLQSNLWQQVWTMPTLSEWSTWDDIGAFFSASPILRVSHPAVSTGLASDYPNIIDESMAAVYYDFGVVELTLQVNHFDANVTSAAGGLLYSSLDDPQQQHVFFNATGTGVSELAFNYSVTMRTLLDQPAALAYVISNLTTTDDSANIIVPPKGNVISLSAVAQSRLADGTVEQLQWAGALTLTSGAPLLVAANAAISTLGSSWLRSMLKAVIRPFDNVTSSTTQLELQLQPVQLPDGSGWLLPLELSVTNNAALWFPAMVATPTHAVAVAQPRLILSASIKTENIAATGYIGVTDFAASPAMGFGSLLLTAESSDLSLWPSIADLHVAAFHREILFDYLTLAVEQTVQWSISQLEILVDSNLLSSSSLMLFANASFVLDKDAHDMSVLQIPPVEVLLSKALIRVAQTTIASLCAGLQSSEEFVNKIASAHEMTALWPFLQQATSDGMFPLRVTGCKFTHWYFD